MICRGLARALCTYEMNQLTSLFEPLHDLDLILFEIFPFLFGPWQSQNRCNVGKALTKRGFGFATDLSTEK